MKKIILLSFALACILTGCKKETFVIPDEPFTFLKVEKVEANAAWADVIPANNDFYYCFINIPKDFYNILQTMPGGVIGYLDQQMKDLYKMLTEGEENVPPFHETCLDKGALYEPLFSLWGDTEYVALAFPYDQDGNAVNKLTTFEYKTPEQPSSDITFTMTLNGTTSTVTPSNNDSYFLWYETKHEVDSTYGIPLVCYSNTIEYFWTYEFFPDALNKGPRTDDLSKYFTLKVGDQFYFMVSGYDKGMSTDLTTFLVTYNGPDVPGTVEKYQRSTSSTASQTIKDGIQRTLERRIRKSAKQDIVRR